MDRILGAHPLLWPTPPPSRLPLGDPSAYYESTGTGVSSGGGGGGVGGRVKGHSHVAEARGGSQPAAIPLRTGHPAHSRESPSSNFFEEEDEKERKKLIRLTYRPTVLQTLPLVWLRRERGAAHRASHCFGWGPFVLFLLSLGHRFYLL